MIFGLEIGMLLAGLYALVRGRLPVTRRRILRGTAARITGVVLLLPLPLALLAGLLCGLIFGRGATPTDAQLLQATAALLEAGILLVCLVAAGALAFGFSRPQAETSRPQAPRGAAAAEQVPEVEPVEDAAAAPALANQADPPLPHPAHPPAGARDWPRPRRPARATPLWPWLLLTGIPVVAGLLVLAGVTGYLLAIAEAGRGGAARRPVPVVGPPPAVREDPEALAARRDAAQAREEALRAQEEVLKAKREADALRTAMHQADEEARRQAGELRDQAAAAHKQADEDRAAMLAEKRRADEARREADEAKKAADLSRQAEQGAKRQEAQSRYRAVIARADREVQDSRLQRAEEVLEECGPEGRGWEWRLLKRSASPLMTVLPSKFLEENVRFSPDGRRLAVTVLFQPGVRVLDAEDGKEVFTLPHTRAVLDLAFGPGGKFLVTTDGALHVWDADGKPQPELEGATGTGAVAISPDGKWLAAATTGGDGRGVALWDLESRKAVHTWPVAFTMQPGLAFSPDGKRLACAAWVRQGNGMGGRLTVYDVSERKEAYAVPHLADAVAYSPDGRRLAVLGGNRVIKLLDAADGRELATLVPGGEEIFGLAFQPGGELLATAGGNRAVRLWDTQTGSQVRLLRHRGATAAGSVAFSPDGTRLAAAEKWQGGSRPGSEVRVWQLRPPAPLTVRVPGKAVRGLDFTRDGRRLVTGQNDGAVVVWDAATGRSLTTLEGHRGSVRAVACRPDGKQIASAAVAADGGAGELILWDAETGKPAFRDELPPADDRCLAYSPDGKTLACAGRRRVDGLEEGLLGLWSADTGASVEQVREKGIGFHGLAFSPDGTGLFLACRDNVHNGEVRLRVFGSNLPGFMVASCRSGYAAVAVAAGPARLVAADSAGRVAVRDLPTKEKFLTPELISFTTPGALCLAPSPDGSRLATAGAEGVVRLLDLADGRELLALRAPGVIRAAAFSPDGKRLAAGGGDRGDGGGFLRVWLAGD